MPRYFGNAATSAALSPSATVTATKNAGNPTANFNCLIENPVNVGGIYYAAYIDTQLDIKLASASALTGPWSYVATVYTLADVTWFPTANSIAAPFIILNPDSGKYTIFYDVSDSSSNRSIGFCSSASITGTYSDHGSAILSPSGGVVWDALGVGEPSVTYDGTNWYMAYMGFQTTPASQHEKVGIASIARSGLGISQVWTKAGDNPLPWGSAGTWNAAMMADPTIFIENGYFWIWCLGHSTITPAVSIGQEGLFYSTTPTTAASWTAHPSNPILIPTTSAWDSKRVFRGGILKEGGVIGGLYTGGTDTSVLTTYKGGNFRLNIT